MKQYSGWWFVLAGVITSALGAGIIAALALAHVGSGTYHGRSVVTLVLMIPLGLGLIVFGLVNVARGTPVTDDSAKHRDFRRRNQLLMRQQRAERRAKRKQSQGTS